MVLVLWLAKLAYVRMSCAVGKAQGCLECLEVARKVGWDVPKGVYDRLWFVLPLKRDRSLVFFNKCWCFWCAYYSFTWNPLTRKKRMVVCCFQFEEVESGKHVHVGDWTMAHVCNRGPNPLPQQILCNYCKKINVDAKIFISSKIQVFYKTFKYFVWYMDFH